MLASESSESVGLEYAESFSDSLSEDGTGNGWTGSAGRMGRAGVRRKRLYSASVISERYSNVRKTSVYRVETGVRGLGSSALLEEEDEDEVGSVVKTPANVLPLLSRAT